MVDWDYAPGGRLHPVAASAGRPVVLCSAPGDRYSADAGRRLGAAAVRAGALGLDALRGALGRATAGPRLGAGAGARRGVLPAGRVDAVPGAP
jgi:hypothetical protein